jgi:hypothetical protein
MSPRPRLAVITTAYHHISHADVIVSRWLEPRETDREAGWPALGHDHPRTEIASLYIQQFLENDIGRSRAERHNVPIYYSVREALTLGGDTLAVDGVILIGEHGDFPRNEFFQKLYPRRELFDEIVAVFRECGRSVPVFNDKHLSYDADSALHMVATARELGFPLMAGSSIPLGHYHHTMQLVDGSELQEGVGLFCGDTESYGYHSIDFLQSLVARRAGGESGIVSVTAYCGDGFWKALSEGVWPDDLVEAALTATTDSRAGDYRENLRVAATADKLHPHPAALCFEHRDGFKSSHLLFDGHVTNFTVALRERNSIIRSSSAYRSGGEDTFYRHFATLNAHIEEFMLTGKTPYPIEHYLLCTLAISCGVRALATPGQRIETPGLHLAYRL